MDILAQIQTILQGSPYVAKLADVANNLIFIVEPQEPGPSGFIRGIVLQDKVLAPTQIAIEVHGKKPSDQCRYFFPANSESLERFIGEHYLGIVPEIEHDMISGECGRCGSVTAIGSCIGCEQPDGIVVNFPAENMLAHQNSKECLDV